MAHTHQHHFGVKQLLFRIEPNWSTSYLLAALDGSSGVELPKTATGTLSAEVSPDYHPARAPDSPFSGPHRPGAGFCAGTSLPGIPAGYPWDSREIPRREQTGPRDTGGQNTPRQKFEKSLEIRENFRTSPRVENFRRHFQEK